ncbi:hypothetical protein BHE74_00052085 [Ensete ventricosum]|nr:hypothetical protein BHE74_00052085 [Ensete ventricosum]
MRLNRVELFYAFLQRSRESCPLPLSTTASFAGYTNAAPLPLSTTVGQTSSVELRCLLRNLQVLFAVAEPEEAGGQIHLSGYRGKVNTKNSFDGVGKVPLLVGADAIVVVHKEDDLVQKHALVEELRKPTGSIRGRESRRNKSPTEEEKADALEVFSFNVDERLPFDSKKR